MMMLRLSNRGLLIVFTTTLAFLVAVALAAVPAGATVIHHKEASFNGSDAPGGPFGVLLVGDAVDQSSGDVWVLESNAFGGNAVLDKFTEAGVYAGVQITGVPTIPGQETFALGLGSGTAVDNSAGAGKGDVYVADTEHGVVDRFSEAGTFLCQITAKTPVSATESAHECNGAAGSATPDLTIRPAGVAVDASGHVYVADEAHEAIDKFSASGAFVSQIKDSHLAGEMRSVALDAAGNIYVQDENIHTIEGTVSQIVKFDAAGAFVALLRSPEGSEAQGVGVDPKTGNVYASEIEGELGEIAEYEPSGTLLSVTATPGKFYLGGLAVNGATGKLYAAEVAGGTVAIFSGDIVLPTVTIGAPTQVTETSATLQGHLDLDAAHGGGEITECRFEYGATSAYGHTVPCSPEAPYLSGADVSANVTELVRFTTYHFRLKATNANGSGESADATFTTAGLAVIDSAFAHVSGTDVTLRAQINPLHFDTTCRAQYVDDASFQTSKYANATTLACSPEVLAAGFGDQRASVSIKGLPPGVTYHYRFLAENAAGLSGSADKTFATYGAHAVTFEVLGKDGLPFTQAAGHPYELDTSFKVNAFERSPSEVGNVREGADGNLKDLLSQLPAGLIGDPSATAKCTRRQLILSQCPGAAQVGVMGVDLEGEKEALERFGIYNIVPPKGVAAELGASIRTETNAYIDARLRTGGDYGVTAEVTNITALSGIAEASVKLWGVPADASHDGERQCPKPDGSGTITPCSAEVAVPKPFLRNPTSCLGPLTATVALDSWQSAGLFSETSIGMPPITGCGEVRFTPSLQVQPTTSVADSPSGLHVDLHVPQGDGPEGLAEGDLKDAVVAFPAGLTVNPSSADGLQACSEAQAGFTGFTELNKSSEPGVQTPQFTPLPAQCPNASKLGSVEVDTPLIGHPLPGAIYLARQGENPFSSLLAVYITVYDPQTGVVVKLPGRVEADPVTGQLSTTVDQSPQVPFEDFKLSLFEGARSPFTTPSTCGSFSTTSLLSPWSGGAAVSPSSPFVIGEAPGGGVCPATVAQEPNTPAFSAGTFSPIAGSYSPFVLHLGREDGSQPLRALSVTLPEGLIGKLAGTSECSQAAIEAAQHRSGLGGGRPEQESPSCPAASEVGIAHVGAGSGAPFYVTGHAYLAGPYQGAPFSIVVITPAVAGPFDLGTVVVRAALSIDPYTARVTVKSDAFPTILDGIPLDIRAIAVEVTRSQFTLNPTSCEKMAVTGTAFAESSQAALSSPFQVGGCNGLAFKPSFSAFTKGKNSRPKGASLTVKLAQKPGEANLHKVDLALPIQLPSRLSTLKLACPAAQFESNPAGCPAASNIGTGKASTPLLSVPFTGPAYLVSHGGAEFPDIEFVLQAVEQGGDIKIVLDGKTQIKNGVTYSHFETVPDAPISSFETVFPQGPYSILAANVAQSAKFSLCGQALRMGTTLTAQNGVVVNQSTKIQVTGCAKVKTLTRAQKLTKALKACHKDRNKAKRAACVKTARKKFGPIKHKK